MAAYLLRKLISTIPTLFGVTLIIFVLFNLVGGDPALMMVGKHATAAQIEDVRREYGLDQPLPVQYVEYLKQVVTFDYGRSWTTHQKVGEMIVNGISPSLTVTMPALFLTTVLAIVIALFVACFRGRWLDKFGVILCVIGMSVSVVAYILFGQYVLAFKLHWFPITGFDYGFPERFAFVALPVLIWVVVSLGYDVRFYRTAVLEEITQDYVRTARSKGVKEVWVYLKHVLANCTGPIITNVVVEIPLLITGIFLLEHFFGIPGLGGITIDALNNSDFPVIKAMATLLTLLMVLGNLATDILYAIMDPRVELR